MDKKKLLLVFLIFLLFAVNYQFLNKAVVSFIGESIKDYGEEIFRKKEFVEVERVIDGDTIVVGEESVRLLGINSPEMGEEYYEKAKEFLKGLVIGKKIELERSNKKDRYNRVLGFIFISQTNLNAEMVRAGLANVYILDDRRYEKELRDAWEECIGKNLNLCEKSADKCAKCIDVSEFEEQNVVLWNKCYFDCYLDGWEIKDEGSKKFIFGDFVLEGRKGVEIVVGEGEDSSGVLYWENENYVWTSTGDTLFLRDAESKLVLWEGY